MEINQWPPPTQFINRLAVCRCRVDAGLQKSLRVDFRAGAEPFGKGVDWRGEGPLWTTTKEFGDRVASMGARVFDTTLAGWETLLDAFMGDSTSMERVADNVIYVAPNLSRIRHEGELLPYHLPGRMAQFARAGLFVREQWFVDLALRGGAFPRLQDYTVFRKVEATDNSSRTGYNWKPRRIGPGGETFAFQGDPVAGARERPRRGSSVPPKVHSVGT